MPGTSDERNEPDGTALASRHAGGMPAKPHRPVDPKIVVVVEKDPSRAAAIADALGQAHAAAIWPSLAAASARLRGGEHVDLLVVGVAGGAPVAPCRALKEAAPDLLVLVLYFDPPPHAVMRALEAGADDSAAWPVDLDELRLRVETLIDRGSRWSLCQRELAELRRLAAFKDDLVSLIVHDLRNPLAGMIGFLSSLEASTTGPAHEPLREDIEGALGSARKLEEVLGELLQIRLLEEGALTPLLARVALRPLLQSAANSLEGVSRERGVLVAIDAASEGDAQMDGKLVRRALENLIANAIRYSPRGATVTVMGRATQREVCFEIADDGPGIPDQFKETVFGKFTSVESERGEARRGFGLGLYQVKLVVDAHGGQVAVHDRATGGAVFEMRLPRR